MAIISVVIVYETWLGIVRVQDYFHTHYGDLYSKDELKPKRNLAASMEGKLKE